MSAHVTHRAVPATPRATMRRLSDRLIVSQFVARRRPDHSHANPREPRAQLTRQATAPQSLRAEVTTAVTAAHQLSTEALKQACKIPVEPAVGESDTVEQPDIPIQRGARMSFSVKSCWSRVWWRR